MRKKTQNWVFLNGEFIPQEKASISIFERGFLLGDGLFETMRAYNGRVFKLREHLERLYSSAKFFELALEWKKEELEEKVVELVSLNKHKSARVRLTVSRGELGKELDFSERKTPTVLITALPLKEREKKPLQLLIAPYRIAKDSPFQRHKSLSFIPYLYALNWARKNKADDALLLDTEATLLESTRANIFFLKGEILCSPCSSLPLIPGITRKTVIEIARELGFETEEGFYSLEDLKKADCVFLTNSVIEFSIVKKLAHFNFSPEKGKQRLEKIFKHYRALTLSI